VIIGDYISTKKMTWTVEKQGEGGCLLTDSDNEENWDLFCGMYPIFHGT
jgi:hypothetical protein